MSRRPSAPTEIHIVPAPAVPPWILARAVVIFMTVLDEEGLTAEPADREEIVTRLVELLVQEEVQDEQKLIRVLMSKAATDIKKT